MQDSDLRPLPSQSSELTTALIRDGIYTKIPNYEDKIKKITCLYKTIR